MAILTTVVHLPAAEGDLQFEQRIANLSDEQKTQLAANVQSFRELKPAEQTHLVKLQERIEAHPESVTLNSIMENFHAWFAKLPESDRMHFRKLTKDDERIAFIRETQERQRRATLKSLATNLSPKDEEAVYSWAASFMLKQKSRLMNAIPPEMTRKFENIGDENKRTLVLTCMLFMKRMGGPGYNVLRPGPEDFLKLKPTLSPEAIKLIEKQPDEQSRMMLVHSWVLNVLWRRAVPDATSAKLDDFEKKLPGSRREQLDRLSMEDHERELRTMYIMASFIGFRPGEWEHGEGERPPSLFGIFGKGPGGPGPEGRGPGGLGFEGRGPEGRGPEGKGGEPRGKGFEDPFRPFPDPPPDRPSPDRPPPGKK